MDAHETSVYSTVVIIAIVLIVVVIFFILAMFYRQRRFILNQNRRLMEELSVLEGERMRISRDLHDDLGTLLTVAKIQVQLIQGKAEDEERIKKALEYLDDVHSRMQSIARNLTPSILARKGLREALRKFTEEIRTVNKVEINLDYSLNSEPEAAISLQIFRMIQELMQNAMKHSKASKVLIKVEEKRERIRLFYKDNGMGFDINEVPKGHGLDNLENRILMLGGNMKFFSSKEEGTEYLFIIPNGKR